MLVDDHALVRTAMKEMLNQFPEFKVVADVSSAEEAIKIVKDIAPNVILMDVKMPNMSGFEATRRILRINPLHRILALSACNDELVSKRFIEVGAKGYLSKNAEVDEIRKAIQAVHAGEGYISHQILTKMVFREADKNKLAFSGLSNREWEVAEMVLKGEKAKDIGRRLYLSPKTVNSYRYRIFKKLGVRSDIELVRLAISQGIVALDEE